MTIELLLPRESPNYYTAGHKHYFSHHYREVLSAFLPHSSEVFSTSSTHPNQPPNLISQLQLLTRIARRSSSFNMDEDAHMTYDDPAANAPDAAALDKGKGKGKAVDYPAQRLEEETSDDESDADEPVSWV
jgi:hypothetical protein